MYAEIPAREYRVNCPHGQLVTPRDNNMATEMMYNGQQRLHPKKSSPLSS